MPELSLLIEPQTALPAGRIDELTAGLADDLRTVRGLRVAHAQSPAVDHGKSQQAWELGMLVVGGLFSATTMRALAQIAVAYADRIKARSIRLRNGDREFVITGETRLDPRVLQELAQLLGGPHGGPDATTTPALPAPRDRGSDTTGS
ncbi:hypothetical protein DLJ46_09035 [Micromonospora globispora]|uniref:Uncharacterized protein n=1 Tax=Micromonospora globispora TaxID=1450148 RepID=A0A317K9A0_9ACTN|nr:hypothetical protein [Micromonospora globispora]PWU49655.1 hypothetical protein DLJ46_09035 [Micromonospora globispora]RQW95761.1 hypothetical protein DKL51_14245 [Micromonospora globispora]